MLVTFFSSCINNTFIYIFIPQIEEQKMVVQFELENLEMRPDPEPVLTDLIHAVSFLAGPWDILS